MITNLAGYTLSPLAFSVSHRYVPAQGLIVPALGEPIQPGHPGADRKQGATLGKPDGWFGEHCGKPLAEITDSADNSQLLRNTEHSGIGAERVRIDRETS